MSKLHRSEAAWQDRVSLEVEKIKSQKQFRKKDEIVKAWVNNRKSVEKSRIEMSQKCPPVPYVPIPKSVASTEPPEGGIPPKKRKFVKVWNESLSMASGADKGRKAQIAELSSMPPAISPPTMAMWAPIERNVLVEDQQHSNIPYFGDDVIEKDQNFIANLVEEVNSKMDMSEDIDDSTFLSLVNSLATYKTHEEGEPEEQSEKYIVLYRPKTDLENSWADASIKDTTLPGLIVFQAISSRYPDFGSTDDMIKKYKTLTNQKAKPDFVPNIDGPDAEAVTAERALHSYKSLLCRRCFLYDCPLHNDPYVETPVPRPSERVEDLPLPTTPCGCDCFLSVPGVMATLSPRTPATKGKGGEEVRYNPQLCEELNPLRDITGTDMDVWTGSEITLFRMLVQSLPSNWCAIAQIMITKKCRQVWEFSKEEIGNIARVKKVKTNSKSKKKNTKAKQAALYKGHSQGGERENSHTYFPCHHPGQPCSEEVCTCKQSKNFCEKYCYCPVDCRDRFPGCRCKSKCTTNLCACFLASRECDPDLCNSCLDGTLELNPETNSCRNVVLQRRMGKKLYVAPSDIAGWGCFLGDKAVKNEFIAEYVGEMITQEESERRGKVYDKAKCSYMFNLNDDFCVDAARIGGKIRFANHSSKPNCKVKILLVNGDHRIGIYANRNIELGEELFFNYGPDARALCPDLVESSSSGEEEDLLKIRRQRKKRTSTQYNLRQFKDPDLMKVKPCLVQLKPLSGIWQGWGQFAQKPGGEPGFKSPEPEKNEQIEEGSIGAAGDIGESRLECLEDSMDELIISSSESEDGYSSVEIMSSDSEMPPPLRVWRIKREIKVEAEAVIDNIDEVTSCDESIDASEGSFNFKLLHRVIAEADGEMVMDDPAPEEQPTEEDMVEDHFGKDEFDQIVIDLDSSDPVDSNKENNGEAEKGSEIADQQSVVEEEPVSCRRSTSADKSYNDDSVDELLDEEMYDKDDNCGDAIVDDGVDDLLVDDELSTSGEVLIDDSVDELLVDEEPNSVDELLVDEDRNSIDDLLADEDSTSKPRVVYDLSSGQESESEVSTDGVNSYADLRLESTDEDIGDSEQGIPNDQNMNASVICYGEQGPPPPLRNSVTEVEEPSDWDVIMVDKEVPEVTPTGSSVSQPIRVNSKYVRHQVILDDGIPALVVRPKHIPHGPQVIKLDAPDAEMLNVDSPSPEVVDIEDDPDCEVLDQDVYPSSPPPLISNRSRLLMDDIHPVGMTQYRLPPNRDEVVEVRPSNSSRSVAAMKAYNVSLAKRPSELPTYNRMRPNTASASILPDNGTERLANPFYQAVAENEIIEVDEVINLV